MSVAPDCDGEDPEFDDAEADEELAEAELDDEELELEEALGDTSDDDALPDPELSAVELPPHALNSAAPAPVPNTNNAFLRVKIEDIIASHRYVWVFIGHFQNKRIGLPTSGFAAKCYGIFMFYTPHKDAPDHRMIGSILPKNSADSLALHQSLRRKNPSSHR